MYLICLCTLPYARYSDVPHSLIVVAGLLTVSSSLCDTRVDYISLIRNSCIEGISGVHLVSQIVGVDSVITCHYVIKTFYNYLELFMFSLIA